MSISWGVVPAQPDDPGFRDWLASAGCEIPEIPGRYPTLQEFVDALEAISPSTTHQHKLNDTLYEFTVGEAGSEVFAHVLGSIRPDGELGLPFLTASTQEATMVEIVSRLSADCGPMVLHEQLCATPIVVEDPVDVSQAVREWRERMANRYSDSGAK